jgi:hypothetical protein
MMRTTHSIGAALMALLVSTAACNKETPAGSDGKNVKASTGATPSEPATAPSEPATAPATPPATPAGGGLAVETRPTPGTIATTPIDPADYQARERPPELGKSGKVVAGVRFRDAAGANTAVLLMARNEKANSVQLWAYHYLQPGGAVKVLRKVQDHEDDCEFDNMAAFVDGSLEVTDVDGNGTAEVSFAYNLGCVSDVSPLPRKLVVLEGGDKYILRGETRVDVGGGELVGGEFKEDPPQNKWSMVMHQYATDRWEALLGK